MRPLIAAVTVTLSGCATTSGEILDRMDADGPREIALACESTAQLLSDPRRPSALHRSAVLVLGRLRSPCAAPALAEVLADRSRSPELRAAAAWALGELRSEDSLSPLVASLRGELPLPIAERVLEAVSKHDALVAQSPQRLVELVEAMVSWAARQPAAPPALYDLLDRRARTLPVAVQVVLRSTAAAKTGDAAARAAVYQAVFELWSRLEQSRAEIAAAGPEWSPRIKEAVQAMRAAIGGRDPATTLLVLWSLGRLSDLREIAEAAGPALIGERGDDAERPTTWGDRRVRLVAAWALARMQLHTLGARRALVFDLLSQEREPLVLALLADLSGRAEDRDLVQKLFGIEGP
jgi:hypothetical protein